MLTFQMADDYEESNRLTRERLYTTVFSQCFSPCGKFLAACSNFGKVSVFSLNAVLSPEAAEEAWCPYYTFQASDGPSNCIITADRFLLNAGKGCVTAWNWSDVLTKAAKVVWMVEIPQILDRHSPPEINSIISYSQDGGMRLLAGCGDNLIHMWDIVNGKHLSSFCGHVDYVHSIAMRPNNLQFLSGSEDGSVRLWDIRDGRQSVHHIEPHKNENCDRPYLGKWIQTVAVDSADDWMVCGGGPRLCLWHLRSMAPATVFDASNVPVSHALFHDDSVISAGVEPYIHHWAINGEHRARVPSSPTNVFSVAVNERSVSSKVLAVAGNCHKIDICTNFGYRAFSLSFC